MESEKILDSRSFSGRVMQITSVLDSDLLLSYFYFTIVIDFYNSFMQSKFAYITKSLSIFVNICQSKIFSFKDHKDGKDNMRGI